MIFELSKKKKLITIGKLDKIFHMFSNSIDYKILVYGRMRFEMDFKFYLNN